MTCAIGARSARCESATLGELTQIERESRCRAGATEGLADAVVTTAVADRVGFAGSETENIAPF